jgi:hypothetical protein
VLHVVDGLAEQSGDMVVVQRVHHGTPPVLADHQARVAQQPQPVRAGRLLHAHLPLGVAGHEGSAVLVGLNGLRLLRASAWRSGQPQDT